MIKKLKFEYSNTFINLMLIFFLGLASSCQNSNEPFKIEKISNITEPIQHLEKFGLVSFGSYSVYVASGNKTVKEIAKKLGINYDYLSEYNGMSDFFKPEKGTILAIPIGYVYNEPKKSNFNIERAQKTIQETEVKVSTDNAIDNNYIHVVKKNETIFEISRIYDISVKSIAERNGLSSDFQIYTDQKLKIPIYVKTVNKDETQLSSLGEFKDTAVFDTPLRPKMGKDVKSLTEEITPKEDVDLKPSAMKLNLFTPMIGKIIKAFNISNTGLRNEGIDIKGDKGANVYSAYDGTVMLVSKSAGEKLNVVIIKHENNLLSIYAGLQNVDYQKDSKVGKGWKIGLVNEINNTLHFELRQGNNPLNPEKYLQSSNLN